MPLPPPAAQVMRVLRDGGGIYVNGGTSAPCLMTNNYVNQDDAVYAVFYLGASRAVWLRSVVPPF
jgi:hypothetical protein